MTRIGTASEVAWIAAGTDNAPGRAISVAIPPVFEAYATFELDEGGPITTQQHERAVVDELVAHTPDQPWWLGYLETGAHDVVVDDAPRIPLYFQWPYVVIAGGPEQALSLRTGRPWLDDGALPDLFFPADRTWLASSLWDDDWTCFGGPVALVEALESNPFVKARRVEPSEDATPPGQTAY